jgi:serine phosphatase RsbU (regulator of sigma subunit)
MSEPPNRERLLARVMRSAARERPANLSRAINDVAHEFGFRDVRVHLVDLHQHALRQLGDPSVVHEVDTTPAGEAFRIQRTVSVSDHDTTRLYVPLFGAAERLGVLSLGVDTELSDDDAELVADLAILIGELVVTRGLIGDEVALTRRSQDLSLAAELRWMLLPPLTVSLPEVAVSGILEPAYDIAGDTFDYALGDHHVEIAILDAVGHGLEASQLASFAIGAYRNFRRRGFDLVDTLREMDEQIAEQFGESRFVTGQLAKLDVRTGQLRIVSAGHPAPLILHRRGDVDEVACEPCPPLGLGYAEAVQSEVELAPGDAVLFYSDGIVESRSPDGEFFGLQRTGRLFADLMDEGLPTAEVVRRMVSDVLVHESTALRDDATVVLVHWFGPPDES